MFHTFDVFLQNPPLSKKLCKSYFWFYEMIHHDKIREAIKSSNLFHFYERGPVVALHSPFSSVFQWFPWLSCPKRNNLHVISYQTGLAIWIFQCQSEFSKYSFCLTISAKGAGVIYQVSIGSEVQSMLYRLASSPILV